ncbi:MAG TPA: hypothetical protein VN444_04440 [Verrucomicrobiae bacterium]|nr:hypothetical protein [Verrucomicrobiae bacterium]
MLMKVAGVWRQRLAITDIGEDLSTCLTPEENARFSAFLEQYEGDVETRKRVRFAGHTAHRRAKKGEGT